MFVSAVGVAPCANTLFGVYGWEMCLKHDDSVARFSRRHRRESDGAGPAALGAAVWAQASPPSRRPFPGAANLP